MCGIPWLAERIGASEEALGSIEVVRHWMFAGLANIPFYHYPILVEILVRALKHTTEELQNVAACR
jgi:hypothetical protein